MAFGIHSSELYFWNIKSDKGYIQTIANEDQSWKNVVPILAQLRIIQW